MFRAKGGSAKRSPFCFFCGLRADVVLGDTWSVFAVWFSDERAGAWLTHLECLAAARHPLAPEWRVLEVDPSAPA